MALAELTEIDEPERVRLEVLHRVRADQDLGRLDQRHERARAVHRPLDLLVQGLPGRLVRGARGGGPHLLQRRVRTLGPARPQPDQGPGQEVQVVARVREVRAPVPEPDLLLAAPVAVQRDLDRLALQLDRDPDLLQVLLDPGGQVAEVEPVHLDVAGVDQGQRRVAHTGGGQGGLRLGQVIGRAGASRQAAEEHARDDPGRLHRALAGQLDQAGVVDAVPDRLLELRVGRDLGDLRVVVGEQEEQVRRGAVDDLHAGHALRLGGGEVDRDLGLALEHVQLLHVGLDVADHDLAVLRLRAPVLRVRRQHHLRGGAVAGQRVRTAALGRRVERRLGLVGLGRVAMRPNRPPPAPSSRRRWQARGW